MNDNKNRVAATLAIMAMACFMLAFFALGWGTVPAANKDFLNQALIALINLVSIAFGYYLGSSFGSNQKNALIAQAAAEPQPAPKVPTDEAGFARVIVLICLALAVLFAIMASGCATTQKETPQTIAAKSLLTMKETIIATAEVGNNLCIAGRLDAETCQDLKSYYILAGPAYDLAHDAYKAATAIDTATNWDKYNKAVQELGILYLGITQLATKTGLVKLAEGGAK